MKTAQIASSGRNSAAMLPHDRPIPAATETQLYCTEKLSLTSQNMGCIIYALFFWPLFVVGYILEWIFSRVNGSENQTERQLTVRDGYVCTLYEQWRQADLKAGSLLIEHTTNSTKLLYFFHVAHLHRLFFILLTWVSWSMLASMDHNSSSVFWVSHS